jgi:putative membrane protein
MGFLGTDAGHISDIILIVEILITILVVLGYIYARAKKGNLHHQLMLYASILNVTFIVAYMVKNLVEGTTSFSGPESVRMTVYLPVVIIHGIVAIIVIILLIITIITGFKFRKKTDGDMKLDESGGKKHSISGKIYIPLWFITVITGIIVYCFLYVIY